MRRLIATFLVLGLLCSVSGAAQAGVVDSIAGLELWLDADAIVGLLDGDTVAQWDDQSINANHAILHRGDPTYVASDPDLNGMPAVLFPDAGDSALRFTEITEVRTLIAVARDSDTSTDRAGVAVRCSPVPMRGSRTRAWGTSPV